MPNALLEVQATYVTVDTEYTRLSNACETPDQKAALAAQYSIAEQNYQNTLNATLSDDDAQVTSLSTQLKALNVQVAQGTATLDDISGVITNITSAITLGTKLVAMVTSLRV